MEELAAGTVEADAVVSGDVVDAGSVTVSVGDVPVGLGAELLVVSAVSEGLVGEPGTSDAVGASVLVREGEGTVTVRDGVGIDSDRVGSGRLAPPSQEARSMEIPATVIKSARLVGTTRDRGRSRGTPTPF